MAYLAPVLQNESDGERTVITLWMQPEYSLLALHTQVQLAMKSHTPPAEWTEAQSSVLAAMMPPAHCPVKVRYVCQESVPLAHAHLAYHKVDQMAIRCVHQIRSDDRQTDRQLPAREAATRVL